MQKKAMKTTVRDLQDSQDTKHLQSFNKLFKIIAFINFSFAGLTIIYKVLRFSSEQTIY